MRGRRLRWLIVALVAAGCGAGISWYATRDTPLPGGPNRLALYETNLRRGVVYTEGFQSYLAVAAAAGGSETVTVPVQPPGGVLEAARGRPLHHQELAEAM